MAPALQTTRAASLAMLVFAGTSLSACAAIWGFEDSLPDASSDASLDRNAHDATMSDSGHDGPMGDGGRDSTLGDGAGDARDADAASETDASDAAVVDPCTITTPENAVYVANGGVDTGGCGTQGEPCATITTGLAHIGLFSTSIVNVAEGIYDEALSLKPGVTVVGGWIVTGGTWTKDTTLSPPPWTRLQVQPSSSAKTVIAASLGGAATLCTMTLQSMSDAGPGETLYGVFATGGSTTLHLIDVAVMVSGGGDGLVGTNGPTGDAGLSSGCSPADAGSMGTLVGDAGGPATSGTFTSSGYIAGAGVEGGAGEPGTNGTAPSTSPPCITCVTACTFLCGTKTTAQGCGKAGLSGCPGQGGSPGGGGGGGGSSVGIFVWQATVTIAGSTVTVSNGGNGAAGGLGGDGGAGAPGVPGAVGASCDTACGGSPCGLETPETPDGGPPGGLGGGGSSGGPGGGGSGGFSCPIVTGGDASISVEASITQGTGGTGVGGAPSGGTGGDAGVCAF